MAAAIEYARRCRGSSAGRLPDTSLPSMPTALPPITARYLLVIHIPVLQAPDGSRWLERLWAIDLLRHTEYLADFTVVCPLVFAQPSADAVKIDGVPIKFVFTPFAAGVRKGLVQLPRTVVTLWRAVGKAQVVHSCLGGWLPISTENLCNLITRLRRRLLFIIVESSPWRLAQGERAGLWRRFKAWQGERMNRRSIGWSDLAVFTHERYFHDLMADRQQRGHVIPASWIDEGDVLSASAAQQAWREKTACRASTLKLLFAARLDESKGVRELLAAVQGCTVPAGMSLELNIIGAGPLRALCEVAAQSSQSGKQVRLLEPVSYGPAFFELLRGHDAIVVPNLMDEQPRITFDAGAQAVPVLGFATDGMKGCVQHGVTGRLVQTGDVQALGDLLAWAASHREALHGMGLQARELAQNTTHQSMHRTRHALLLRVLGDAAQAR
jgi:glycosyltransferase involved in cell wall biosynthesis